MDIGLPSIISVEQVDQNGIPMLKYDDLNTGPPTPDLTFVIFGFPPRDQDPTNTNTGPSRGTAVLDTTGHNIRYTPSGTGTDSFTYQVKDNYGAISQGGDPPPTTITITIT